MSAPGPRPAPPAVLDRRLENVGDAVTLQFVSSYDADELCLFEMPDAVLDELLQGQPLDGEFEIRGGKDDTAVLVTSDKTFLVRRVESSNTQLLVEGDCSAASADGGGGGLSPSKKRRALEFNDRSETGVGAGTGAGAGPASIVGSVSTHFELQEIQPRFFQLRKVLEPCAFKAADEDDDQDETMDGVHDAAAGVRQGYTFDELRCLVQASDQQLLDGLHDMGALKIDGRWRILDDKYQNEVCNMIVLVAQENDWSCRGVDVERCVQACASAYPDFVVRHCLTKVLAASAPRPGADAATVDLHPLKLLRCRAVQVLRESPEIDTAELEQAVLKFMVDGVEFNEACLVGVALRVDSAFGPRYRYCPRKVMSPHARARFEQLFAIRDEWPERDMKAYTEDIIPPGMSHEAFLLKHTRVVARDETFYIAKFA